jgi:Zn-dependent peptidase ImmA (M78 family)
MARRLRHGFKTAANEVARQVRAELGLAAASPLDIWALADHLEIPCMPLSDLSSLEPEAVNHFLRRETGAFSALTLFAEAQRLIVYNDAHAKTRQASDLAHELAHALLLHPAQSFVLDGFGCREWPAESEAEADWLGGALLVPDEAAVHVVRSKLSVAEAARVYGISEQMMRWRLNVTGAYKRVGKGRR